MMQTVKKLRRIGFLARLMLEYQFKSAANSLWNPALAETL
jgi:hypothetical protein